MSFQARQVPVIRRLVLLPFVLPRHALALPVALTTSSVVTVRTYLPLVVISLSILFLVIVFLSVKTLYMKHRRIGSIHSPPESFPVTTTSNLSSISRSFDSSDLARSECRIEHGTWYRGLLVGCFGSPTWETRLTTKLTGRAWPIEQRRKASFAYQLHRDSKRRSARSVFAPRPSKSKNSTSSSRPTRSSTSFFSFSSDADEHVAAASSTFSNQKSNISAKTIRLPQLAHTRHDHTTREAAGSSGALVSEVHAPRIGRRASPSSIRLVDGPGHGDLVLYSFLSGTPPKSTTITLSMGMRDSLQLSTCSLKSDRKPVPSLPPLPPLPPLSPVEHPEAPVTASEYLPRLHLSQPGKKTSSLGVFGTNEGSSMVSKVPYVKRKLSRPSDVTDTKQQASVSIQGTPAPPALRDTNRELKHKRSGSHKGLAIGVLDENGITQATQVDRLRIPTNSSQGSTISKKPLKPCLRQSSITSNSSSSSPDNVPGTRFTFTPSISEISTQAYSQSQTSLRTPVSDIDIRMLGLDRFRWNDEVRELKIQPTHAKKDSFALVADMLWEKDSQTRDEIQHVNMDVVY